MNPEIIQEPQTNVVADYSKQPQTSKGAIILLSIFLVIAIASVVAFGYFYLREKDAHEQTTTDRDAQVAYIESNSQVLQDAYFEPSFRQSMQENANRDCFRDDDSALLFNLSTSAEKNGDRSIKKHFAVGQYICHFGYLALNSNINFIVLQSYDGSVWELTSSSSNKLPKYIYDSDPNLFDVRYNNPLTQ